VYQKWL